MRLKHEGVPETQRIFYLIPHGTTYRYHSGVSLSILVLPSTSSNNNPHNNYRLNLTNTASNTVLATAVILDRLQPIGRMEWVFRRTNQTHTMTLSRCTKEQFTCDDGTCLPLSRRCDGINNCGDDSDEICTPLLPLQPLHRSYRLSRPPTNLTNLAFTLTLHKFIEVDIDLERIELWLQVRG
ncbi:hypothetical protein Pmani_002023 [Petrolisthes manimaculis]|uniref:Uncharacterized protein n=1 Tax=Petrolisthes manimaculis TaxID=1843537 RepID=A0AAE1URE9_9EUCA|nr:hypothetical protein Pmani_002023 [Petrolisthes manimaculis]